MEQTRKPLLTEGVCAGRPVAGSRGRERAATPSLQFQGRGGRQLAGRDLLRVTQLVRQAQLSCLLWAGKGHKGCPHPDLWFCSSWSVPVTCLSKGEANMAVPTQTVVH